MSRWCSQEGDLDSVVPCLYQDCTFSEGCYLVSKLWTKVHHLKEDPVVCVATIVMLREREAIYSAFWEVMVKRFPLLKQARVVGCDLAHIEDSGIAKYIPYVPGESGFRAKCDRHGRQCFKRAAADAREKTNEQFWVNQYELMVGMSTTEFEDHDQKLLDGRVKGCSDKFTKWWSRSLVRKYLRDWMRVECLESAGFVKGKVQSSFDVETVDCTHMRFRSQLEV